MTHINMAGKEQLAAVAPLLDLVRGGMGFVPNSFTTMAHWPEMLGAFAGLAGTVLNSGEVDAGLKQLVAYMASHSAGCRYCQAHTAHQAVHRGVDPAKQAAVFDYADSPLFSPAERAALQVAARAGMVPNAVTGADMAGLVAELGERGAAEVVAVIALFGFLNRWNDTMATTLEEAPGTFAAQHLAGQGWQAGKHA